MTRATLGVALWIVAQAGAAPPPVQPLVSVWYRGTPAGTPVAGELAVIRALGFGGIVWPGPGTFVDTLAGAAGLKVTRAAAPQPATPQSALRPPARVDLVVDANPTILTALAWRAVAHGARLLAFDGHVDRGSGLENPDRSLTPWAHVAIDVARQFSINERFIVALAPGPGVITTPDLSPALDVSMLDTGRSWVVIATNTSGDPVTATVRLPDGTPYAIWLNLLDGSTLAMNGAAAGPRWDLKLDARSARVYMIEKIMK
ncbi:MAG TPA: hypothetical protein VFV78_03700 [Vicinamibacterales bacterium]|nr:hypothetical protein [Vicinamibacterales bacterium]